MSGIAYELTISTLLPGALDEASEAQIGIGNSEIASIVACRAFVPTTAQTMAEATKSASRNRARSANGVVIPSAMLIDVSSVDLTPVAGWPSSQTRRGAAGLSFNGT